jgi:hypothetical protein
MAKPELVVPPRGVLNALHVAPVAISMLDALEVQVEQLNSDLLAARRTGNVGQLARAFVTLHYIDARIDQITKRYGKLFEDAKTVIIPQAFEDEGQGTSMSLAEGYRVTVSYKMRASIRKGMQRPAHDWLRKVNLGDIIVGTVNASSLSSSAKLLAEEDNIDLPAEWFNVTDTWSTSVTRVK